MKHNFSFQTLYSSKKKNRQRLSIGISNCGEKERKTSSSSWKSWDEIVFDRGGLERFEKKGRERLNIIIFIN